MTTNDILETVVCDTLQDNSMEDTKENRLDVMLNMHDGWEDNVAPSIGASMLHCALALEITHMQMRLRLNL